MHNGISIQLCQGLGIAFPDGPLPGACECQDEVTNEPDWGKYLKTKNICILAKYFFMNNGLSLCDFETIASGK